MSPENKKAIIESKLAIKTGKTNTWEPHDVYQSSLICLFFT